MIRSVTDKDIEGILNIYAPIIKNTIISFETEVPDVAEMENRIREITRYYPWLVCEKEGKILGYAYASPHRSRAAYQWSADVSVYVDENVHRKGVGRGLVTSVSELLKLQGLYNAYAGVALPNTASTRLFEKMGFERLGVFWKVGYKHGKWRNVAMFHKPLQPHINEPTPPVSVQEIKATACWQKALDKGISLLNV